MLSSRVFLWLGTSKQARRVKGGEKREAYCPECDESVTFLEVEVTEKLTVFSVLDVLEDTERAFRCIECDLIGQLRDDGAAAPGGSDGLSPEATARLEKARAEERAERDRADQARRAREARLREARADDELAALKRKMGMAEPDDGDGDGNDDEAPKEPKRPFWKRWRRK